MFNIHVMFYSAANSCKESEILTNLTLNMATFLLTIIALSYLFVCALNFPQQRRAEHFQKYQKVYVNNIKENKLSNLCYFKNLSLTQGQLHQ